MSRPRTGLHVPAGIRTADRLRDSRQDATRPGRLGEPARLRPGGGSFRAVHSTVGRPHGIYRRTPCWPTLASPPTERNAAPRSVLAKHAESITTLPAQKRESTCDEDFNHDIPSLGGPLCRDRDRSECLGQPGSRGPGGRRRVQPGRQLRLHHDQGCVRREDV